MPAIWETTEWEPPVCLNAYLLTAVIRSFPPELKPWVWKLGRLLKDQQDSRAEDQGGCAPCSSWQKAERNGVSWLPDVAILTQKSSLWKQLTCNSRTYNSPVQRFVHYRRRPSVFITLIKVCAPQPSPSKLRLSASQPWAATNPPSTSKTLPTLDVPYTWDCTTCSPLWLDSCTWCNVKVQSRCVT